MNDSGDEPLEHKINKETARICWNELQPHFAAGNMVFVDDSIDLVNAAKVIAEDRVDVIKGWMDKNQVMPASDELAIKWQKNNQEFWAVVIKPLILVQCIAENKDF